MTGKQMRAIRKRLNLSQSELAKLLDLTANTVARRERGELPISRESELAMRAIEGMGKKKAARD